MLDRATASAVLPLIGALFGMGLLVLCTASLKRSFVAFRKMSPRSQMPEANWSMLGINSENSPPSVATGTVTFDTPFLKEGTVVASVTIHRCEYAAYGNGCPLCGETHDATGLSVEIAEGRVIASVYDSRRKPVSLLQNGSISSATFTIEPAENAGARLYESATGGVGQTSIENASTVWVDAGRDVRHYTVTAFHPLAQDVQDTVDVYVVQGTIDVNGTSHNGDDVVCRYSTNPPGRPTVDCSTYLAGWPSDESDPTVVFSCPKLRFPLESDTSKTLSLDKGGNSSYFQISGHVQSETTGDAEIEARIPAEDNLLICVAPVTVLWVDGITMRDTQDAEFSMENNSEQKPIPQRLGLQYLIQDITVESISHVIEFRGEVHPSDSFEHPNFDRDNIDEFVTLSYGETVFSPYMYSTNKIRGSISGNDTSSEWYRDDNSQLCGVIFDLDTPGFRTGMGDLGIMNDVGTRIYMRCNFLEFAKLNGVRCSNDFPWFVRITAEKTGGPGVGTYQFLTREGHPSDNSAGMGQTSVTID